MIFTWLLVLLTCVFISVILDLFNVFSLLQHLESERHQNFAQSTQYKVVDDIISKLVYEFAAYKDDDTGKIKR